MQHLSRSRAIVLPADSMQRAIDHSWNIFVLGTLVLLVQLLPGMANAAGTMEGVICGVALGLKNGTGPIIATIAVAVLGVGALFGKTSWTLALTTAIGISVLMGADKVVTQLFGKSPCANGGGTPLPLTELNAALCEIAMSITGSNGRKAANGLATMGVIVLAFSAFFGRISWGPAMAMGAAIGLIFGAGNIVTDVYGKSPTCIQLHTGESMTWKPATSGGGQGNAQYQCEQMGGTWQNGTCI